MRFRDNYSMFSKAKVSPLSRITADCVLGGSDSGRHWNPGNWFGTGNLRPPLPVGPFQVSSMLSTKTTEALERI